MIKKFLIQILHINNNKNYKKIRDFPFVFHADRVSLNVIN